MRIVSSPRMGEPLDNLEAVVQAVRVMSDPLGFAISLCHITISTSGEAPAVPRLLRALPRARLAFSLHSADDATRSRLMPVNRRVPLSELADAMRVYVQATKHRVSFGVLSGVVGLSSQPSRRRGVVFRVVYRSAVACSAPR